jgi:hypothetical protein
LIGFGVFHQSLFFRPPQAAMEQPNLDRKPRPLFNTSKHVGQMLDKMRGMEQNFRPEDWIQLDNIPSNLIQEASPP